MPRLPPSDFSRRFGIATPETYYATRYNSPYRVYCKTRAYSAHSGHAYTASHCACTSKTSR